MPWFREQWGCPWPRSCGLMGAFAAQSPPNAQRLQKKMAWFVGLPLELCTQSAVSTPHAHWMLARNPTSAAATYQSIGSLKDLYNHNDKHEQTLDLTTPSSITAFGRSMRSNFKEVRTTDVTSVVLVLAGCHLPLYAPLLSDMD